MEEQIEQISLEKLNTFYSELERKVDSYIHIQQIASEFSRFRKENESFLNAHQSKIIQAEIDCFSFDHGYGSLKPECSGVNTEGKCWEYPNLSLFDDETLSYLEKRWQTEKNPVLRSRYAHVLWSQPKTKHNRFGHSAGEEYTKTIGIYEKLHAIDQDRGYQWLLMASLLSALRLSRESRRSIDHIWKILLRILNDVSGDRSTIHQFRFTLTERIIHIPKLLNKNQIKKLLSLVESWYSEQDQREDPRYTIDLASVGIELCAKLQHSAVTWYVRRGDAYVKLMDLSKDKRVPTVLSFCHEAINNFRMGGSKEKADQYLKLYDELSSHTRYVEISYEVDMSEVYERFRITAEKIIEQGSEALFVFLSSYGEPLLPSVSKVREITRQWLEKNPLFQDASHLVQDGKGRPAKHYSGREESLEHFTLQEYDRHLFAHTAELLKRILLPAVEKHILTCEHVTKWLTCESWLGAEWVRYFGDGQSQNYRWSDFILPIINDYITQLKRYFINQRERPNFIMAIDSLTLKIEGIIRHMLSLFGATTSRASDKKGQNVIEDTPLEQLLENELLRTKLGDDDLFFIRFVLIEKAGLNLRNRIAHSHLIPREYSVHLLHFLMLIVFRLSRFQLDHPESRGDQL